MTSKQPPKRPHSSEKPETEQPKVKSMKTKYTTEQIEQLKKMTSAEKAAIRCGKCSDYFHKEADCKNAGRRCYNCDVYGHEAKNCTQKKKGKNNTE